MACSGVALIDVSDAFSDDVRCGVVRNCRLIYRNQGSLTGSNVRSLAPVLTERVVDALDRIDR